MPRAIAVINESCVDRIDIDIEQTLATAFERAGLVPDVSVVAPPDLGAHLEQLDTEDADRIIGAGGDGTMRTIANAAMRADLAFGIVPLGTMNLLAKDLDLPLDVEEAATVAATGRPTPIDVGRVNGEIFLHSSVLGIVPRLARWRERLRSAESLQETARTLSQTAAILARIKATKVQVAFEDARHNVETFAVAVAVGPVATVPPEPLKRTATDAGELAMYLSRHEGNAGLATLLAEVGTGLWGIDANVECWTATSFNVDAHRRILVSNDGEVTRLDVPLHYEIKPRALRVLTR